MILGIGALYLSLALVLLVFDPSYYDPQSPVDYLTIALYSAALLALPAGLAGLISLQKIGHPRPLELFGFSLTFIGAVMAATGNFAGAWLRDSFADLWMYLPGMLLILVGLALFGIGLFRSRLLPVRYSWLLTATPFVGFFLGGLFSNGWGTLLFALIWIVMGSAPPPASAD